MKSVLGLVIISFSAYSLLSRREHDLKNDSWAWLFGFGAGVLGGAYGMNGPPLVIYGSLRKWPPERFRATLQGYFLPASLIGMLGYWIAGLINPRREPFLHPVTANGDRGYFSGTSDQSPDRGSSIPSLCSLRVDRDWSSFADAGWLAPG